MCIGGVVFVYGGKCYGVHRCGVQAGGGGWCWWEIATLGVREFFIVIVNGGGL